MWVNVGYFVAAPPKKPPGPGLAKAVRAGIRHVPGHSVLSRGVEEAIFRHAEVMSEGSLREAGDAGSYFGSTMITVDLDALRSCYRGSLDGPGRERLRDLVDGSVRMRLRAMRIACAEVVRRAPDRPFGTAQVETQVRVVRGKLHLDVDLEVPFDVSSARRQR